MLLIPHLLRPDGEGDGPACDDVVRDLQPRYPGRLYTLRPPYDEGEVKYAIAQCDFFIGARMHSCIAALSQCVPAAAMAYSGKFIGVLRSVGVESAVADLRKLSINDVLSTLGSSYDARHCLKALLQSRIPEVRNTVFDVVKNLSAIMHAR